MKHRPIALSIIAVLALLVAAPALMFSLGRSEKTSGQAAAPAGTAPAPAANPQALAEASKNLETIQYSFREVAKMVLPVVVEVDVTEQIKKALLSLRKTEHDFSVILSGKKSRKVHGLYKPDTREIVIHNRNFKNDNEMMYTAIL